MPRQAAPAATVPAWAAIAGVLADAVLALVLLFAVVDQAAPPQDLPWKPLSADQAIGLATRFKLDRLSASGKGCMAFLSQTGLAFTPGLSPTTPLCQVSAPVRLRSVVRPSDPLMSCSLAAAFAVWERQAVQPAAARWLHARVVAVDQAGTYACRGVRGATTAPLASDPSQHAQARAIDVSGFELSDGRTVTVARDWRKADSKGLFLADIRGSACRVMHATLSPDYNAVHAGHLHLDVGPYRLCS